MWQKIKGIISSRFARNIYFWLIAIIARLSGFDFRYTATEILYFIILLLPLLAVIYLNNVVYIPRLLIRKHRLLFLLATSATILCMAWISGVVILHQIDVHPEIDIYKTEWVTLTKDATTTLALTVFVHAVIFSLFVLIFSLFWYLNDYSVKKKALEEAQKKQMETELSFLKNQLNPHFLFNTLNNLYGLSMKGSPAASESILQLSAILRYLLYESNAPLISFRREREIMQAYIELELLRLSELENITFSIHADGEYNVPPLLWLPVLENVFKHTRHHADAEIEYTCHISKGEMHIRSRNSAETTSTTPRRDGGIGLTNLRKRLQLLYPGRHTFSAGHTNDAYIVDINITLHEAA